MTVWFLRWIGLLPIMYGTLDDTPWHHAYQGGDDSFHHTINGRDGIYYYKINVPGLSVPIYRMQAFQETPNRNHWDSQDRKVITHLVIHHTHAPFESTMSHFTKDTSDHRASAHFVVTQNEAQIPGGQIIQVVPENKIAWHAGPSFWRGDSPLNAVSIGVEFVHQGYQESKTSQGKSRKSYVAYDDHQQLHNGGLLLKYLMKKYNIHPLNVIGHQDIAFERKEDPTYLFPWDFLFRQYGLGAWITPQEWKAESPDQPDTRVGLRQEGGEGQPAASSAKDQFLQDLKSIGYQITNEIQADQAIFAFRSHWSKNQNQALISASAPGDFDEEDRRWARKLCEKYLVS